MEKRILIIEDDLHIVKTLSLSLKLSGYSTDHASSFYEAWEKILDQHFDLLLMDIGLPDGSGLDLCTKIRESGNEVPIIFLSALTDEATVVKGIKSGADDYLRKPFGLEELKARISKFIKRLKDTSSLIKVGDLTIDTSNRMVTLMDKMINLGKKEMDILTLLARRSGDIVTRENIIAALYDSSDLYDRTVDSHMSHLRKKLREIAGSAIKISSVYGLGYRLELRS